MATDIVIRPPTLEMTDARNLRPLLLYLGLLSIRGADTVGRLILHVPNLVVREQLFSFLIQGHTKHDIFKIDMNRVAILLENMASRGDWKLLFSFIAEAIREQNRTREHTEGEAYIKGFLLAYSGVHRYYQSYPKYELNKGPADFLSGPSPSVPAMSPLTYLLEVKYVKAGVSEEKVRTLVDGIREQLLRYNQDELVMEAKARGGLKLIMTIWRSWEPVLLEEVL